VPDDWSASTNFTLRIINTGTVSGSGGLPDGCAATFNTRWQVQYVPIAASESTSGAGTTTADTICVRSSGATYTANNRVSDEGNISLTGTNFSPEDVVSLELTRLGSDGSDDYTGNSHVLFILVEYTAKTPMNQ
jgi:hypothetical protein